MRRLLLSFLVVPLLFADRAFELDRLIEAYHRAGRFDGAALVAEEGRVIVAKGYGLANRELEVPITTHTKFRLGSITKQFTAALVLQFVEAGKLRLEAAVAEYLPEYPNAKASRATIHQLLNHTSGIPSYTGFPDFFSKRSREPFTPMELTKLFWERDPVFPPGSKFDYSNSGYHLLGVILEKVSGESYEALLEERILKPLGMKDTGYDHSDAILAQRAAGYKVGLKGIRNADFIDMSIPFSAGGMYSTVEDLRLWDAALYTNAPVSEKSKALMFRPGLGKYGYGWFIDQFTVPGTTEKVARIGHGGGIPGFASLLTRFPARRQLIVLLSNTPGASRLAELTAGIAAVLYGRPPIEPPAPPARRP